MSLIGSIVSDVTSLAKDPGKLVADAANAVLPSNMKAVGDILGGITDIQSGNPLAALSHLQDALKDLPQLLQALGGAAGANANAAKPAGTAGAEPAPPQARATSTSTPATPTTSSTPTTTSTPSSTPAPAAAPSTASTKPPPTVTVTQAWGATVTRVDDGTNTTSVAEAANGTNTVRVTNDSTGKLVGSYTGSASNISVAGEHVTISKNGQTFTAIDNGTNTVTVGQNGAQATVGVYKDVTWQQYLAMEKAAHSASAAGAPSAASPGAPAAATSATGSAQPASGGATASASSSGSASAAPTASSGSTSTSASGTSASAAAPADLASLMALSPDQFMQAVTSGKIPPDVANDQSAMMQVQARMNQITQMNQLVTSMMAAAHQMQMSIIQNIRC